MAASVLGDDLSVNVVLVGLANREVSDADLERLKGLPQLQSLWLNGRKVTDAGINTSKDCPNSKTWVSTARKSLMPGWNALKG